VRATRARAGLEDGADAPQPGLARPFALDLLIDAPRRIFVRGRGIDAELGGRVRVGGTTSAVLPSGGFELIRGRLDLLGKRFDLTEGSVTMEGRFAPRLRFVAAASTDSGPAQFELEGPADAPEIRFVAEGLPEEEVVARLLFGRDLTRLSPFQVAQMASALASLAGAGGEGLVGSLRRSAGLDDLDILTDETGATGLRVGKYLSQNAYADVALNPDGSSEVTLNLDLTETVTARGRLGDAGQTGLGLFFERDY
jgi:translocation and assembly module TamB